jgi:Na+-driven multidrug efflux pump
MLGIGLPSGGEFALIAIYMTIVYGIIQVFGPAAQAGFGIGVRLMQSLFLPAVAIGFATSPVVGQNFGARQPERVRQAFYTAAMMSAAVMTVITLLCHIAPAALVGVFSTDPAVIAAYLVGTDRGRPDKPLGGSAVWFILLVAMVVWVTLDLNQPNRGLITVDQEPMERVLAGMG